MIKYSALLALIGSFFTAIGILFDPAQAQLNATASPTTPTPQTTPQSAAITEFLSNHSAVNCNIQFDYVEPVESQRSRIRADLNQQFSATITNTLAGQTPIGCNAIIGTDSGNTRNFNFIQTEQGVYKVITESAYRYDATTGQYTFPIVGFLYVPIDATGSLMTGNSTMLNAISDSHCKTDALLAPTTVSCLFAVTNPASNALAMGQLSYQR
jgi:hypothetical protein